MAYCNERHISKLIYLLARTGPFENVTPAYLTGTNDKPTGISCDVCLIKIVRIKFFDLETMLRSFFIYLNAIKLPLVNKNRIYC